MSEIYLQLTFIRILNLHILRYTEHCPLLIYKDVTKPPIDSTASPNYLVEVRLREAHDLKIGNFISFILAVILLFSHGYTLQ